MFRNAYFGFVVVLAVLLCIEANMTASGNTTEIQPTIKNITLPSTELVKPNQTLENTPKKVQTGVHRSLGSIRRSNIGQAVSEEHRVAVESLEDVFAVYYDDPDDSQKRVLRKRKGRKGLGGTDDDAMDWAGLPWCPEDDENVQKIEKDPAHGGEVG